MIPRGTIVACPDDNGEILHLMVAGMAEDDEIAVTDDEGRVLYWPMDEVTISPLNEQRTCSRCGRLLSNPRCQD